MRAFGIDPGIGRTGWGVIEKKGASYTVTNFGLIETAKTLPMHTRLQMLYNDLTGLLEKYNPDCVAVEDLFFNTNAKTALIVGQARGVVLLACANYGLLPSVYTPLQVKIAITGYGRAEKNQVGIMVKSILRLPSVPTPDDVADALAIAITDACSVHVNML